MTEPVSQNYLVAQMREKYNKLITEYTRGKTYSYEGQDYILKAIKFMEIANKIRFQFETLGDKPIPLFVDRYEGISITLKEDDNQKLSEKKEIKLDAKRKSGTYRKVIKDNIVEKGGEKAIQSDDGSPDAYGVPSLTEATEAFDVVISFVKEHSHINKDVSDKCLKDVKKAYMDYISILF